MGTQPRGSSGSTVASGSSWPGTTPKKSFARSTFRPYHRLLRDDSIRASVVCAVSAEVRTLVPGDVTAVASVDDVGTSGESLAGESSPGSASSKDAAPSESPPESLPSSPAFSSDSVSYTHLTLPTIYSV